LRVGANSLGRDPQSDIVVYANGVSRRHCLLWVHASGGCEIQDASSQNGTYIKHMNVDHQWKRINREWLCPGDLILVCDRQFVLACDREDLQHFGDVLVERFSSSSGYEIIGELGRGTSGVVYKANWIALRRLVAIKMPTVTSEDRDLRIEGMLREARLLANLTNQSHEHLVKLHAVGVFQDLPFLVRELVEGQDFEQWIGRRLRPWAEAATALARIASTIHEIHERGFVHRNLHPSNILIGSNNTAKLIGFGSVGFLAGSPELPAGAVGQPAETDIHALGKILDWMCAKLPGPVPNWLERICWRCSDIGSAHSYVSAADLAADLTSGLKRDESTE
jgi:pSer/pThr/pTyr-binding forkhead associated (FHA) protein